jgi:hypothetical protein
MRQCNTIDTNPVNVAGGEIIQVFGETPAPGKSCGGSKKTFSYFYIVAAM